MKEQKQEQNNLTAYFLFEDSPSFHTTSHCPPVYNLQARATFATLKTYVYIALYPGEVLHVGTVNVGEVDQVEVGGLPGGRQGRPRAAQVLRPVRRNNALVWGMYTV